MKKILIALLVTYAFSAFADDLVVMDGTVYRNVTIVSADPDRMLIVHDGGGCQVCFKDLKPDSLTAPQRKTVEEELIYYTTRKKRLEQLRIEKAAFELAQKEKGLIEFEGNWMTPSEKETLLADRQKQMLEMERLKVQLATEQAELEKERLQTEQARRALDSDYNRSRFISTSYSYGSHCRTPHSHYTHGKSCSYPRKGSSVTWSGSGGSISISSGSSSFDCSSSSSFNRGPFNRYGAAEFNRGPFNR